MTNDYEDDNSQQDEEVNAEATRNNPFDKLRVALLQGFCAPIGGVMSVPDSFISFEATDRCINETSPTNVVVMTSKPGATRLARVVRELEPLVMALFLLGWTLHLLGESVQFSEKSDHLTHLSFTRKQ